MLEEAGVIEEYRGPWGSPVILTWNSDGSSRMCVDYIRRNAITEDQLAEVREIFDEHPPGVPVAWAPGSLSRSFVLHATHTAHVAYDDLADLPGPKVRAGNFGGQVNASGSKPVLKAMTAVCPAN